MSSNILCARNKVGLAGFTDLLGKPYEPSTLLTRIARFGGKGGATTPPPPPKDANITGSLAEFSIEHLVSYADGDESIAELFESVRANLSSLRPRLGQTLEARDQSLFETHVGHVRSAIGLLQATTLHSAIERGRRLFAAHAEAADLSAARRAIEWCVDDILEALERDTSERAKAD